MQENFDAVDFLAGLFSNILIIIVPVALIVVALAVIVAFKINNIHGWLGERKTASLIERLPKDIYNSFHDIYVSWKEDSVTQIDHIIVSCYGIFVVETKNYAGYLFGKEYEKSWTQKFARGKSKKIDNPIKQNEVHIYYLAQHLKMQEKIFHSVICFVGPAVIKTPMPDYVMRRGFDNNHILGFQEKILSEQEERDAINKINELKSAPSLKSKHKRYLQRKGKWQN